VAGSHIGSKCQLSAAILTGGLAPGAKISEPALAREYDVSRGRLPEGRLVSLVGIGPSLSGEIFDCELSLCSSSFLSVGRKGHFYSRIESEGQDSPKSK
jgi:hypothetical protein